MTGRRREAVIGAIECLESHAPSVPRYKARVERVVPASPEPRAMCLRCRRPQRVCYCAALPRLDTRTTVVLLQHPRERDMPIGTARMASLCLPHSELHVGVRWGESPALAAALADPAYPPILLYPGPGAKDILHDPPTGPVTLVVVDGTWSQAKNVVRDNPVLHALPRYAFDTPEPSHYRIRREPRAEYVSTIEALMHVLGVLEGDAPRFRALLDPLNAMVDAQLACQEAAPVRRVRHPRPARPPRPPLPAELEARWDDLVCIVGEANAWPYQDGEPGQRDELVHWLAHRPSTGATFEMVVAPAGALSPTTSFHIQVPEERLLAGAALSALFEAFAAWSRPTDVVCTWGHHGPQLLTDAGGPLSTERLDLRAAAQKFTNQKLGSLADYAASLGSVGAPLGEGRGGQRLAQLAHILATWHRG